MRICYELYSDERYHPPGNHYLMLGGVICTMHRGEQLVQKLAQVRSAFNLTREMHWGKVSKEYLDAYKAWADVFLQDDLARFSLFVIDTSDSTWKSFSPRANKTSNQDERLASAFYQFLLVSFGGIFDTISLADVLLGAFSYSMAPSGDPNYGLKSEARLDLVEYCKEAIGRRPMDKYHRAKIVVRQWVPPEQFNYR